jgi:DNA-directed RNA polymerase
VSPRRIGIEIHGDAHDIGVTLEACLQLHRWTRAFALLRQLELVYKHNSYSPEMLIEPYNRTLEAMVMDLVTNRSKTNIDRINKWVEVDMKRAGVEPDAQTYALKLKVALATMSSGSKRDRTVRRYWEFAKQNHTGSEVVGRGILTDSDLGKLSQICPEMMLDTMYEESGQTIPETPPSRPEDVKIMEPGQKGLGLSSLRESLNAFFVKEHAQERDSDEPVNPLDVEDPRIARQMRVEVDALNSAIKRWKTEHEKMVKLGVDNTPFRGQLSNSLWLWHTTMAQKIRAELEKVETAEAKTKKTTEEKLRSEYGPFLRLLTPEHLSALVTISLIQIVSKAGIGTPIKVGRTVTELGRMVEMEVEAEQALKDKLKEKRAKDPESKKYKWRDLTLKQDYLETSWGENMEQYKSRLYSKKVRWSSAIHARVGAVLCEMLLDSAKIRVRQDNPVTGEVDNLYKPAFTRETAFAQGKQVGVISLHPEMVKILTKEPPSHLIAKQLPMISKPRPWTGYYEGGYLSSNTPFIRGKTGDMSQRDYGEAAASRGDLDQIFAGIDVLGSTGWKINQRIFQVMLDAWNTGEAIANLPPAEKVFPEVTKPATDADARTRFKYYEKVRGMENERIGIHSNRCFQSFQMEIAKAYLNETFYLPHNVDFRGRAYPIPPYLNQMGADNCRGLLKFADGRALGESGLRWLKIHLSNVYGYDKASLSDRANFPMEHFEDILDSVRNPLDGKRWWLTAEDPWQCLAACFELAAAMEHPNPAEYVSHIPVHQDGSCNGLQHYAALGGDMQGARQVNLEPGDKPADVYTGVAELVKAEVKEDAKAGHELGMFLDGKIVRKVVKQTVMTNVYGVTFLGAVRQVRNQIDDLIPELKEQRRSGIAGSYIARKIFKALGTMFSGAHHIQYWLGDCANRIGSSLSPAQLQLIMERSKKGLYFNDASGDRPKQGTAGLGKKKKHLDPSLFRSSVIWTTPLKLPVVQPYRINKGQRVKTNLQTVMLHEPTVADAVDKRKQLQAFPPNFVHSLDATHMILSALEAEKKGLSFTAVHDSFWTHAADIDTMNELLRDAFIRMHSEDIIGRLAAEFERRYRGHWYLAAVKSKSLLAAELKAFRASQKYENGNSGEAKRYQELLWELERQELLASEDPEEVALGKKMVTPASIFAKHDGEQYLFSRDSLGVTANGNIPNETSDIVLENALEAEDITDEHNVDLSTTLEPLIENNAMVGSDMSIAADADVSATEEEADQAKVDLASQALPAKKKSKKSTTPANIQVWLPLTFREVPKKGDFDVSRLKHSKYFFS